MRLRWIAAFGAVMIVASGCGVFTTSANEPFRVSEPHLGSSPAGTAFGVLAGNYQTESIDLRHFDEQRLLKKYWGGKLLAVAEIPGNVIKTFVNPGVILSMAPYVKNLPQSYFYPAVWSAGMENGTRYRLGGNVKVSLIIYNQGVFAKAGITKPPKTWSEFSRDLKQVKNYVKVPFEMAPDPDFIESAFLSNGGVLPRHKDKNAFDNSAGRTTFDYFRTLAAQGLMKLSTDPQIETDVAMGTTAAIAATSPIYDRIVQEARQNHIHLGVFSIPAGTANHTANVVGGEEFAMFAHHTKATTLQEWKFIQWFDAPKQQAYYVSHTGYGPVTPQAVKYIPLKTIQANPSLPVTLNALTSPDTVSNPGVSGWGKVQGALEGAFTNAVSHKLSVRQALNSVDSAVGSNLS